MELIILSQDGDFVRFLYNALADKYPIRKVILEKPVARRQVLVRRIRNLGLRRALGQAAFMLFLVPFLRWEARSRYARIVADNGLSLRPIPEEKIFRVPSVNSEKALEEIRRLSPDLVLVSGTRLLTKTSLSRIKPLAVNIHAGITPDYRGGHGGYWALVNGEPEKCGVSIHRLDAGIDTGDVFAQDLVRPEPTDNFTTYPLLQLAAGIKLLPGIIPGLASRPARPASGRSRIYYHPTFFEYLFYRFFRGVK